MMALPPRGELGVYPRKDMSLGIENHLIQREKVCR